MDAKKNYEDEILDVDPASEYENLTEAPGDDA